MNDDTTEVPDLRPTQAAPELAWSAEPDPPDDGQPDPDQPAPDRRSWETTAVIGTLDQG
jgi:hypothetical protein